MGISGNLLAVDTECTGLNPWKGDAPFAISFCDAKGGTWFHQFAVDPKTRKVQVDRSFWKEIRNILEDPDVTKVLHNAKFDVRMLELGWRIKVKGRIEETMFAAHVCDSMERSFGLKQLAAKYLDIPTDDLDLLKKTVIGLRRRAKKEKFALGEAVEMDYWLPKHYDPRSNLCETYCTLDTQRTMLLWKMYVEIMEKLKVREVYEQELKLWKATYTMETRGVRFDPLAVKRQGKEALQAKLDYQEQLVKSAGYEINLNSPIQLGKFFYDDLKLPPSWTEKGNYRTDVDALLELYPLHEAPRLLVKFRAAEKLGQFFSDFKRRAIPDPLNAGGVCIHPDFNQVGPITGRFSCRNPNLQNVADAQASRSAEPIQARTPFGPRPGYVWYHYDYDQLEVRVFADVAREPAMLAAIKRKQDIHTTVTNRVWGGADNERAVRAAAESLELDNDKPSTPEVAAAWAGYGKGRSASYAWLKDFDWDIAAAEASLGKKNWRTRAKNLTFAKIFGGGWKAVMAFIRCSEDDARQFITDYDEAFPGIGDFQTRLTKQAALDGYILTRFGRRIPVERDKAYRAVNYLVQGSAADLMKRGMYRCYRYLKRMKIDIHLVMTIHDELVFEANQNQTKIRILKELRSIMEDSNGCLGVPTPVDVKRANETWIKKESVAW